MSAYRKFPNLPWWLGTMDHNTLTDAEKEVLDLDYYCRRHGNRLSHRNAAKQLHRSERKVSLARKKLEELLLRRCEIAKGSCKVGFVIEYKNEADWRAALRAQNMSLGGALSAPRSSRGGNPLRGSPPSKVKKVAGEKPPAGVFTHPLNPPQGGLGGSVWHDNRKHPQWKKYLTWGKGRGMSYADAESHADSRFAAWLKDKEAKEKDLCKESEEKQSDSSPS